MSNRKKRAWLSLVVMGTLVASALLGLSTLGILSGHARHAFAASVTSTDYYPPGGSDPWGTAFDSSGNVWLALPGCDPSPYCSSSTGPGRIAVFNPGTNSWIADYQLPSGYGQPLFLTFDQSGNLWFPMPMTNTLGTFNVTTQTFQEWAVPTAASGPWGVAADSLGNIWFTEHYSNQIGRFTISTHTFKEIATPATNSIPYGITVDKSNNVWFTENSDAVALIGEYTTGGKLNEYKIRNGSTSGSGLTPHLITLDPNGNVWWSEGFVARIGELKVAQAVPGTNSGVTEYSYTTNCSSCGTHTSGISVGSNGTVWFDDSLQSIFGSFSDTGTGTASVYNTPTQNSHPHDGLNVDAQNRVWFDEEFANKLALAIPSGSGTGTPTPTATMPTITPTVSPVPGSALGTDTFQRANQSHWGTASDGQSWGGDANTVNAFSISGNTGLFSNGGGASYNAILGPSSTDEQGVVTGSLSNYSNSNFGPVLRWTDTNNWYKAFINGKNLIIQGDVNRSVTTIAHTTFTATAGTSYTIRFQVVGTTLSAKVWTTGTTEPSAWMVIATNSALTSGSCGIRVLAQNGVSAKFTAFQATNLTTGSTVTPTPTATISPTATATVTTTPTVTPTPGATLGTDTFQRANQSHWGTASDGQSWGGDANTVNAFSISGNTGLFSNGGGTSYNAILGPSSTDEQGVVSGSLSSFSNSNFGLVLRWVDTNNWYKAYIDGNSLVLQSRVNGNFTTMNHVTFAATAGTSYTIRFQVVGTTLSAKVWATGTTEPSAWMVTATNSALTSGSCGIRILAQSGITATFTAFQATVA